MQARSVSPGIDAEADLRRDIESPCVFACLIDIESRFHLGILRTRLEGEIGLEGSATVEGVASDKAKGQLEQRVLLVGVEASAFAYGQDLTSEILVIAVIGEELSLIHI